MSQNSWDVYLRRINLNGSTQKDRKITKEKNFIIDKFTNNPSYEEISRNDVWQEVHITQESYLINNPNKKKIICKPNEKIYAGDSIVWNDENWIVIESENLQVYYRGVIEKCKNNLVFLSSSGTTITIPCIISENLLMGSDINNYYIMPDNRIYVTVGYNSNNTDSSLITLDQRFILGNNAYKVESIDDITKTGLITYKMMFDKITEDDNLDLGIANYTSRSHIYAVNIINGTSADITLGNTLQLEVDCTNNSEIVTSPNINYYLGTGATGVITVTSGGLVETVMLGSGTVYVEYASASDSISLDIVAGVINNYSYSLIADIQPNNEVKYYQTKTFTAYKYYATGTQVTGAIFEFSVTLGTGASSSNYLLTTSSNTTCTVKALQYPYNITLVATDQTIPANNTTQVISLKGLI